MKKLIVLILMISVKTSFAQPEQNFYCPCGAMLSFYFSKINFHKPKTDCNSGFGFCMRVEKMTVGCMPCSGSGVMVPRMEGDGVNGYFLYDCGQMKLHLPRQLAEDEMFRNEKTDYFEIEDRAIRLSGDNAGKDVWVKGGSYPVEIIGEELVIPVDVE